ncbi:MAG: RIP metalloprotease RseP [Polyangiaceae bacterium]
MQLLYFVVLISVLIFIHEFGHFAVAKVFGVKVLEFAIGFGPKVLRVRGRQTTYSLGVFPLGGFVRMLEESKSTEPIAAEDQSRTFESLALWKRVLVVLAGPVMNLAFPVLLFTVVFFEDKVVTPAIVGAVVPGKPADGKLAPGDVLVAVGGTPVSTFHEVQRIVAKSAGVPLSVSLLRGSKPVMVTVVPEEVVERREFDLEERVARLGISPNAPAPVIGVPIPESPASRAGLRTFDRVVAVNGRPISRYAELDSILHENRGETLQLAFLRPVPVPAGLGASVRFAVYEAGIANLTPLPPPAFEKAADGDPKAVAGDVAARSGIEPSDMYVAFVPEGSSEWQAGLRPGDRITRLDGSEARAWGTMEALLRSGAARSHTLEWTRRGVPHAGTFQIRKEEWDDEFGQHYELYVFRTTHWSPSAEERGIPNPNRFTYAVRRGVEETRSVLRLTALGLVRLVQGRVSFASVSGPITIFDIAGQAGERGATYFLWAMALISVNLGLFNLLPIPVLDGGHLAFLVIEAVSRRPLSLRVRELASLVGMGVLILLMLVAFKNDVTRHWDVLRDEWRELVRAS